MVESHGTPHMAAEPVAFPCQGPGCNERVLTYLTDEDVEARDPRHLDVGHHQVGRLMHRLEAPEQLLAIGGHLDLDAEDVQAAGEHAAHLLVVVGDPLLMVAHDEQGAVDRRGEVVQPVGRLLAQLVVDLDLAAPGHHPAGQRGLAGRAPGRR